MVCRAHKAPFATRGTQDGSARVQDCQLRGNAWDGQAECTFNGAWGGSKVPAVFYISSYFWDRATDVGLIPDDKSISVIISPSDFRLLSQRFHPPSYRRHMPHCRCRFAKWRQLEHTSPKYDSRNSHVSKHACRTHDLLTTLEKNLYEHVRNQIFADTSRDADVYHGAHTAHGHH